MRLKPYYIYNYAPPREPLKRGDLAAMVRQLRIGQCLSVSSLDEANAVNVMLRDSGFVPMQRSYGGVVLVWKLAKQKKAKS